MKSYPKKCCPRQTLLYVTEIWLASSPRRASPVKCIYTGNFQPYKAKPYMAKPYNLGYQDPAKEGWPSSYKQKQFLSKNLTETQISAKRASPTNRAGLIHINTPLEPIICYDFFSWLSSWYIWIKSDSLMRVNSVLPSLPTNHGHYRLELCCIQTINYCVFQCDNRQEKAYLLNVSLFKNDYFSCILIAIVIKIIIWERGGWGTGLV